MLVHKHWEDVSASVDHYALAVRILTAAEVVAQVSQTLPFDQSVPLAASSGVDCACLSDWDELIIGAFNVSVLSCISFWLAE